MVSELRETGWIDATRPHQSKCFAGPSLRGKRNIPVFGEAVLMRKILTDAAVISIGLLGILCTVETKGAPISSCVELPGSGSTPSGPAAVTGVQSGSSILNVFVRGQNDHIFENAFTHSGFSGWSEVPGGGLTRSEPAAVVSGGIVKVFVRGLDSRIYENDFNGTGWAEVPGGGITLSGPVAVVDRGTLKLFVRGLDDGIWENDLNSRGWFPVPGGGLTISAPVAISYRSNLYLFVRAIDNRIYLNVNGTSWSEVPGGGLTLAGPSALVDNNGNILKLFVTGLDDGVWENDFNGTNWSGWSAISAHPLTPSTPAAVEAFSIAPELFLTTEDGKILECFF
jgi:hypothetical protein